MTPRMLLVLAAATLLAAGTAFGANEKWEISAKVEMSGLPMAMTMTPEVATVCVPPGQMANEKMIPEKDGCKLTGFRTSGNTSTFSMQCPPPQNISGQGQIIRQGPDAYTGQLVATGNINGMSVQMRTTYSGRKVGACDGIEAFTAPRAP